jgi:hypothetical protein
MASLDIDKVAEVHRQLDRLLLFDWDPIGVSDCPEAHNEYRGYVRGVYDVAVHSRSALAIAEHLAEIEHDAMGLSGRAPDQLLPVAHKILELLADFGPLP